MGEAPHLSVLLSEVVEAMAPAPGRRLVDATFGAGGYSRAFLEGGACVAAFDRDPAAVPHAGEDLAHRLDGFVRGRHAELEPLRLRTGRRGAPSAAPGSSSRRSSAPAPS